MKHKNILLVCSYLAAIVAANLSIVYFGPQAAIWNALVFIGLDLTARDNLHEAWHGRQLWLKMAALIATGSLLSWILNAGAGRIAVASFAAFGLAGLSDALVYAALGSRSRIVKINGSNVISSIVDSAVFVAVAGLPWFIVPGQIAAKIIGGIVWSVVLSRLSNYGLHATGQPCLFTQDSH